jgi:exosortase/archaeosortase family protein
MWLLFRAILPGLVIFLLAPVAWATTDAPNLVQIDIDLHWTVPVYGPIRLFGSEEWQNGVGYTNPNVPRSGSSTAEAGPWRITGNFSPCFGACVWVNFAAGNPAFPGAFVLDLEQVQQHGSPHFEIGFGGQFFHPVLLPGDYAITEARFTDSALGGCCPFPTFLAESGHISVVATPELKLLRRLTSKHIYGRELAAAVNPRLQTVSAWGATTILRALQIPATRQGVFIDLPSVRLEVQEWCSGLVSMKWLLLLGVAIALVLPTGMSWKIAFVVAAPLIALEVNMLRIASVGAGVEMSGRAASETIKEWAGWSAMGLGVAQVVGLGWVMTRRWPRTV